MRLSLIVAALVVATIPAPAGAQPFGGSQFDDAQGMAGRGTVRHHFEVDRARGDNYYDRSDRDDWRGPSYPIRCGSYGCGRASQRESFDDWWHERPHRSYPAWMARNTNCERLWWSGGGWRC